MRAVVLRGHGGPEVLTFEEIVAPTPGSEEVLVEVRATSLNRADLLQRMGFYPNPFPDQFDVPGMEFSGVVRSVGARVRACIICLRLGGAVLTFLMPSYSRPPVSYS